MLICIDSNVFIWGIKKQASPGQENMLLHAQEFFKWVKQEKHHIILPSIVLAECLQPEPPNVHAEYVETAQDIFQIVNFGIVEALKYAEILNSGSFDEAKALMIELGTNREKMKLDHLILSSGLANGAKILFTTDGKFKQFAEKHITVETITKFSIQTELYG
jgi:predicted nucleic acid-binding protein